MDSVLYIGTDTGVVTARSGDGRSWQTAQHGLKNWEISELAVPAQSPNKIFAGTRGDGVWVSEDFGETWRKPNYGRRGPGKVRSITIDPHNPQRLYAGCEPVDVFMSEDEGKNWIRFDSLWDMPSIAAMSYPLPRVEPHARDVTVDSVNPDILYVALQLGFIAKSTDQGRTWTLLDKNLDCDVHTIVTDPSNPHRLVIAVGGHDSRRGEAPGRALYTSDDSGANWTPAAMDFTQEYSVPLVRDPHNPRRLYSALAHGTQGRWRKRETGAEAIMIRSDDNGKTWRQVGAGIDGREFPETIAADATVSGRLYAACRNGGFYISEDSAQSWRLLDLDLEIKSVNSLVLVHAYPLPELTVRRGGRKI